MQRLGPHSAGTRPAATARCFLHQPHHPASWADGALRSHWEPLGNLGLLDPSDWGDPFPGPDQPPLKSRKGRREGSRGGGMRGAPYHPCRSIAFETFSHPVLLSLGNSASEHRPVLVRPSVRLTWAGRERRKGNVGKDTGTETHPSSEALGT